MAGQMNASVSAGVVITRGNGPASEVLMVVRREDNTLGFPAGKLDGSETPLACAKRECREEAGFLVVIDGLITVVTLKPDEKREGPSIGFIFHGTIVGKVATAELETRWISFSRLLVLEKNNLFLPEFHIPALLRILAGWEVPSGVIFSRPLARA